MGLVLSASAAGTVFEWYDFFIFGSLAAIIAKHFYAGAGDTQSYILTLMTFAVGFLVRPFGAIVFGHYRRPHRAKRAFLVTITIMGLATFAMGLMPEYSQIGVAAPYALVAMRVLQGFAVGGEYGGAAIYVAEHTEATGPRRRDRLDPGVATLGLFLALGVVLITRTELGEDRLRRVGLAYSVPAIAGAADRVAVDPAEAARVAGLSEDARRRPRLEGAAVGSVPASGRTCASSSWRCSRS